MSHAFGPRVAASPRRRRSGKVPAEVASHLHGWRHPSIVTAAALSIAAGYAQFAATATLPDVAAAFGETGGRSIAAQAGLSLSTLGLGLGLMRLTSLFTLPLSGLADRFGRRSVLLGCAGAGLALTGLAAVSQGFWVFVLILAVARPTMSATNAIAGVVAAEETRTSDRALAIALVTAGYGVGAGLVAILRSVAGDALGFRGVYALAVVPLLALPFLGRVLEEPARFTVVRRSRVAGRMRHLRTARLEVRRRFWLIAVVFFALSLVTGPVNTFLFLFAERVVGLSPGGTATAILFAGPLGAGGLLIGRVAADRVGRRWTCAVAHVLLCAAAVITYSGSGPAVFAGYLTSIAAGSALAPAFGAVSTELFPTSIRGTVAGALTAAGVVGATSGLVVFGALVAVTDAYLFATLALAVPAAVLAVLYLRLPETRTLELEESAPEA